MPLTWTDGQGVTVTKTYVFRRGRYDDRGASTTSTTARPTPWSGASYVQLARHVYSQKRSMFDVESYAYRGPAIYDGKRVQKLDVEDRKTASSRRTSPAAGWRRCSTTSSTAAVPPAGEDYQYTLAHARATTRC